jgi:hypothetical protein
VGRIRDVNPDAARSGWRSERYRQGCPSRGPDLSVGFLVARCELRVLILDLDSCGAPHNSVVCPDCAFLPDAGHPGGFAYDFGYVPVVASEVTDPPDPALSPILNCATTKRWCR